MGRQWDLGKQNSKVNLFTVAKGPVLCYMEIPGGSVVKNPHAMQETGVWSLGQEDPLEKEIAVHPGILAWEIPWTGEPGGLQSMGSQELDMT